MKKRIIIAVAGLLLTAVLMVVVSRIANSRDFQFFGEIVASVNTPEPIVALTFDDGPTPGFTDEILRILRDKDVKATFFLIGNEIERNPEEAKKIVNAGHEIGNHSYSHVRMVFVTPSFVRTELERTDELIRLAGYEKPTHFRPPYAKKLLILPYHLSQANRLTVTWDVEPESYPAVAKNSDTIARHVIETTRPGSIILLHVMYDRQRRSMGAVEAIIAGLKEKGFRFETVSGLLGR